MDALRFSRRFLGALLCALSAFALFLIFAPLTARAELIESFSTEIEVRKDATFRVVERIDYSFDGEKHGIFRYIPTVHSDPASSLFKERYLDIAVEGVTLDGEPVLFEKSREGENLFLRIGDPDATISGTHRYEISYTVAGGISYEENGGAELYWNVTGNEWKVPMRYAEATVSSPDGVLLVNQRACYRGYEGEAHSCAQELAQDGSVRFSATLLNTGEGLTVAQAVNRTLIQNDVRERYKSFLLWGIFILAGVFIASIAVYRYKTKFDTDAPIIPQYEPYPGVKPMYAGFLFDKRLDPRDITAGIVYLAEQGYLKIRKIETRVLFFFEVDDYEITAMKPEGELGTAFERELLTLLFGVGETPVGTKVTLQELKHNYAQARENYKVLQELTSKLREDLRDQGFFMSFDVGTLKDPLLLTLIGASFLFAWFISTVAIVVLIVLFVLLSVIFAGGRRTTKGYEALDHLKGFKDFLSVTDKDRFIFHNAPEKNAEQFMEYLPYAIAFGVEKQWAKTFEHITIPNPDWYDGGAGVTSFNAGSLTQSLGAFSTAFASTSASGSASSGGGSSGGGSGGGGGGSW